MKNQKKYFIKVAALAVLALALMGLNIDTITNLQDFLRGLAMGAIVVILLELVYSIIRSLQENSNEQS